MKKIKKYHNSNIDLEKIGSKLASYTAIAATFLACSPDMAAQCGTAAIGAPLPVDIDGDGTADLTLNIGSLPGPYLITSTMVATALPTFTTTGSVSQMVTATQPGPGGTWNGCITTQTSGGAFTAIVPSATATGSIMVSYMVQYTNIQQYLTTYQVYGVQYAFATGAAIVGLSGGSSCAPAGTAAAFGQNTNLTYLTTTAIVGGLNTFLVPTSASVCYDAPPCTTTGGNVYAGFSACVYLLPATFTNSSGPFLLASSMTSNTAMTSQPGTQFIAVQFASGGETFNGWVEVAYDNAGNATCVATGYQQCSVEAATAAGDVTLACDAVGTATNSNMGCMPPACDADVGTFPGRD